MTPGLERRYRLLLRAYPASWRARRAAEMLGTLADGARPGQRFPAPREVAGLLAGGLRARAWEAGARDTAGTVMDGLYLGAVLMHLFTTAAMLMMMMMMLAGAPDEAGPRSVVLTVIEVALTPLGVVALVRGWLLPVIAVVAAQRLAPAVVTGAPALDGGIAGAAAFWLDQAYPAVVLAGIALAARPRWTTWRPRPLSPWWLAAPGLMVAMLLAGELARWSGIEPLVEVHGRIALAVAVVFLMGLLVGALVDPRVAAAAAVWAVPLAVSVPGASPGADRLPLYVALVVGLLLAATMMTRRLARL